MATANTFGTGANPMYAGRAALDGATMDRWIIVTVDYDRDLEADIGKAAGLSGRTVFMSGGPVDGKPRRTMPPGRFVSKPFQVPALVQVLRAVLT